MEMEKLKSRKIQAWKCSKILDSREDRKQKLSVKKIGLIAGGSGITPMYQVIYNCFFPTLNLHIKGDSINS